MITVLKHSQLNYLDNEVLSEMELDTGAGMSVLPKSVFKDKFWNCKLNPTLVRLKTYDKAIIKHIGEVELAVCYKSIKKSES